MKRSKKHKIYFEILHILSAKLLHTGSTYKTHACCYLEINSWKNFVSNSWCIFLSSHWFHPRVRLSINLSLDFLCNKTFFQKIHTGVTMPRFASNRMILFEASIETIGHGVLKIKNGNFLKYDFLIHVLGSVLCLSSARYGCSGFFCVETRSRRRL